MGHKIRTFRGKIVDIDEIRQRNADVTTIGNVRANARGDELDEWGNIIKSRDQVAREKNSSMSRKSTQASVISSFEDDEEMYELKDDPNVLAKNSKANSTTNRQTETKKPEPTKTDPKKPEQKSTKADETDLD